MLILQLMLKLVWFILQLANQQQAVVLVEVGAVDVVYIATVALAIFAL